MDINIEERMAQLDDLHEFIENSRLKIASVLSVLGWDANNIREKSREMVTCPLNREHYVPKVNLEKHLASCSWRMEGYHEQDIPLPESCGPETSRIVIDKEMRTTIIREAAMQDPKMKTGIPAMGLDDRPVPKTVDRIISNFTPDERRVLYDFAISKTGAASVLKVEELHMSFKKEEKQRPKTFIERLAEERDAKRRRASKKVHTNRKSHTEILREVIQNQMELYEDFLKQESEEFRSDTKVRNYEENNCNPDLKDGVSSMNVACASKKNASLYKEESREDQEESKRHKRSRSPWGMVPGRSRMRHGDPHRTEQGRWQRKSGYYRQDDSTSHRDRSSRNISSTVCEGSSRDNGSRYLHSHRKDRLSDSKGRRRTHSSSDSNNDPEDFHHKRKRNRDVEVNMSRYKNRSYRAASVSSDKDMNLKHEVYGSKNTEKSTASFYKKDRTYATECDKGRDNESYLSTRSPIQKHSWESRNSDSSHDNGSESHRQHMKHKRKKHRRKRHRKREKISPHKSHVSENSSSDFSC